MYLFFIVIIIITIDQIIKQIVVNNLYKISVIVFEGVLSLSYVENTGGAYGLGNGNIIIFIIANIIIIGIITKLVIDNKKNIKTFALVSYGLIISGGIGNLIDRIFRGYVIDYIDINQSFEFPVFNIADICIVIGCISIGIFTTIGALKNEQER